MPIYNTLMHNGTAFGIGKTLAASPSLNSLPTQVKSSVLKILMDRMAMCASLKIVMSEIYAVNIGITTLRE